jgi:hypothetical protein
MLIEDLLKNVFRLNNTMEDNFFSEKLLYNFDFPALKDTGYVEMNEKKIVLFFPEKSNNYVKDCITLHKKFQLCRDILTHIPILDLRNYLAKKPIKIEMIRSLVF